MSKRTNIAKEDIIEYYINGLHTVKECEAHFDISKTTFNRYLKSYGIKRSKEDKSKVYSRAQNSEELKERVKNTNMTKYGASSKSASLSPFRIIDETTFSVYGENYTVDWLKEQYLNKNLPSEEMCKLLNITYAVLHKITQHYHIAKNSQQRYEIIKDNTFKKYGVKSTLELEEVKAKSVQTCLDKYGVVNSMQYQGTKDKLKQTMLNKYGVENYTQTEEYKKRMLQTNLNKYGVPNHMQQDMEHFDIWNNKELFTKYLSSLSSKPTVYELQEFFNLTDRIVVYDKIHSWNLDDFVNFHSLRSHYENDIIKFLKECGVENIQTNDRTILNGKEIDIYLPDYKLGIEFNGDYWHSDIKKDYQDHNGRSLAHQQKSLLAESKGVFLFHIFEYEWNDDIIQASIKNRLKTLLIKNNIKIPARKCKIVTLTKAQKKEFLNENHIQGNDHSTIQYGLEYQGQIVSCMTFIHPKNKKYTWELSRFCNQHGCVVQGGASKLFKHFVETLQPGDTISSYNDITKTKGDLYRILGFQCISINQPNYVWVNFQTRDIRTRYQEQEAGEVERMHGLGYHRLCDCGTKTWLYTVQ